MGQDRTRLPTHADVCPACRRAHALCICVSHVDMVHGSAAEPVAGGAAPAPLDPQLVEARVAEAMRHYYNRDAVGLARFVRGLFRI